MFEPKSIKLPAIETDKYLLTNLIWYSPETGIRTKNDAGEFGNFELIQHGWWNYKDACGVILRLLDKGYNHYAISKFMDFCKDRNWNNKYFRTEDSGLEEAREAEDNYVPRKEYF